MNGEGGVVEMVEPAPRGDRERKDPAERPGTRREPQDAADPEWVLERIQQSFDNRRR